MSCAPATFGKHSFCHPRVPCILTLLNLTLSLQIRIVPWFYCEKCSSKQSEKKSPMNFWNFLFEPAWQLMGGQWMSTEYQEACPSVHSWCVCKWRMLEFFSTILHLVVLGGRSWKWVLLQPSSIRMYSWLLPISICFSLHLPLSPRSVLVGELYTAVIISIFVTDCHLNFLTVCIIKNVSWHEEEM